MCGSLPCSGALILILIVVAFDLVCRSALFFIHDALFRLVALLFVATACSGRFIFEVRIFSLIFLREEVLAEALLGLLWWEDSFELSDRLSHFWLV